MNLAAASEPTSTGTLVLQCAVYGAVAFAVGIGLAAALRRLGARVGLDVERQSLWLSPLGFLLATIAVREVLAWTSNDAGWVDRVVHLLDLAMIAIGGWILAVIALVLERALLQRYPDARLEDRRARHERTKITLVTRLTKAVIATLVVVAILWTIPDVREIGVGILASASVLGVIAGIAAQSSLGNLFAGLQIAFTDALRIDDVVVIDDQWGRIDEITLTYVAVRVWDDTSLILPCTYFTTTPFENWTHRGTTVTGTVELGVDWRVPLDELRQELRRILTASDKWDRRSGDLYVNDTSGSYVKLIAIISVANADQMEPLRWEVREGLMSYIQEHHPGALPRQREESLVAPAATSPTQAGPALPMVGQ